MTVEVLKVKLADENDHHEAVVDFTFEHSGLPLEVTERYKTNGGDWRTTVKARFFGVTGAEVRNARLIRRDDGTPWLATTTRVPPEVKREVLVQIDRELDADNEGTESAVHR